MAIDPRIRERRIEVIREAGRRRLRITLVVASAIIVIGLAYLTVESPLLDVDRVRVSGNQRETAAQIRAASQVHKGDALLFVDTGAVARRVERLPWVEHARVRRDFPGTLAIVVSDFVPTAYLRAGRGRFALVASTGRVIGIALTHPARAVEIRGERTVPVVGSLLTPPAAADVVSKLPARLASHVIAIDVGGTFALELNGGGQVRLGSLDDLAAKGASALAVLHHLAGATFTYIDVSAPQAPVSR